MSDFTYVSQRLKAVLVKGLRMIATHRFMIATHLFMIATFCVTGCSLLIEVPQFEETSKDQALSLKRDIGMDRSIPAELDAEFDAEFDAELDASSSVRFCTTCASVESTIFLNEHFSVA